MFIRRTGAFCSIVVLSCCILAAVANLAIAAETESIDFMVWGNADSDRIDKMVIQAFEAQNPHIKVNLLNTPGNYMDKFFSMIAAGTPPDLAIMDAYDLGLVVTRGLAFDVTQWAERDGVTAMLKQELNPAAYQEMMMDGRLYSVANLRIGVDALFYNKDLFLEGGVGFPHSRGQWTWEDLKAAAIRLTKDRNGDGTIDQKGLHMHHFFCWAIIRAYGGRLLNEDRTRAMFDEPTTYQPVQWLANLGLENQAIRWNFETGPDFSTGDAAMHIMWVGGLVQTLRNVAKWDWDIAPLPAGPAGSFSTVKGNPVIIPTTAKNKELAWEFMRFLGSTEANYIYGMQGRFFPLHRSALARIYRDSSNLPPASLRIITDLPSQPLPLVAGYRQVQDMWLAELRPVWLGQTSAQAAGQKIAELSVGILADAKRE